MATKNDSIAIDTHNRMSIPELEEILKTNCQLIIDNPGLAATIPPILIHSSPGVGKSSIVRQVAQKLGIGFVDGARAVAVSAGRHLVGVHAE